MNALLQERNNFSIYCVVLSGATLRSLSLTWRYFADVAVTAIAENCANLTSLHVESVSQAAWLHLVWRCTKVENLYVSSMWPDKFTDEVLTEVARLWKGLNTLTLKSCTSITDLGVAALIEHCTPLVSVEHSYSGGITDRAI